MEIPGQIEEKHASFLGSKKSRLYFEGDLFCHVRIVAELYTWDNPGWFQLDFVIRLAFWSVQRAVSKQLDEFPYEGLIRLHYLQLQLQKLW